MIFDFGVLFKKDAHPLTSQQVIVMDTYLQPEVELLEGTYIDITYPDEISLPGNLAQPISIVEGSRCVQLPCDQI